MQNHLLLKKFSIAFLLAMAYSTAMAGMHLVKSDYQDIPGWFNDHQEEAIAPMKNACQIILNKIRYDQWDINQNNEVWKSSCKAIINLSNNASTLQVRTTLQKWFTPYQVTDGNSQTGMITGYYNPTILGSLNQNPYFSVPIYAKPRNLVKIDLGTINPALAGHYGYRLKTSKGYQPVPTRAEIAAGVPMPNTPVLAWVHSETDRFFMQIQGSGSIQLNDGSLLLLGYDGQNGQSYYPIGKHLVETGAIPKEQVSMQAIRAWLDYHPIQAKTVLNLDPSFVFFKKLDTAQPLGSMGLPLTPNRSLAVDDEHITLGTLMWLNTYLPTANTAGVISHGEKLQQLMVALDTGGAIKGIIRADVFWGSGSRAKWLAGHMQSQGNYWLLLPNGLSPSGMYKLK